MFKCSKLLLFFSENQVDMVKNAKIEIEMLEIHNFHKSWIINDFEQFFTLTYFFLKNNKNNKKYLNVLLRIFFVLSVYKNWGSFWQKYFFFKLSFSILDLKIESINFCSAWFLQFYEKNVPLLQPYL